MMKNNNGNLPAMALTGDAYTDFAAFDGTNKTSYNPDCMGLTKREQFAAMAMQGLLVNAGRSGLEFHSAAEEAVRQADALLAALEE